MELSEAIRLGAMLSRQGTGNGREPGGTRCAIAAAADAISVEYLCEVEDRYPVLNKVVEPPNGVRWPVERDKVRRIVWGLNDTFGWTREQIADWIETIERRAIATEGAACEASGDDLRERVAP